MELALTLFGASLFLLTVLTVLFRVEDAYGERILLTTTRSFLDRVVVAFRGYSQRILRAKNISRIKLIWHFLLHKLLKKIQSFFDLVSGKMKVLQSRNKEAAKAVTLSESGNHLNKIAEHKQKTALSEKEKQKRKSYK